MTKTTERFLRYVQIDTMSEEGHDTTPSTVKQFDLARLLVRELEEIGASDVYLDEERCYVYAGIPSNTGSAAKLALVAHMDTSPAVTAEHVHPLITGNYQGQDIELGTGGRILSPDDYPSLLDAVGKTIISTDGSTLLGGDDKAGVAIIMSLAEHLLSHPEIPHGEIRIAFTPDEEVGMGVSGLDYARLNADFGYTIDGGALGDMSYECFNAASATVTVTGMSIHPGSAKGKMKNAVRIAEEYDALLPKAESPEFTEGYEGFYHLDTMNGNCDSAVLNYILRDHDASILQERKEIIQAAGEFLNRKYGEGTVRVEIRDSYRNMREIIEQHDHLIKNACSAYEKLGITPRISPIRGGTDGATMSFNGVPCPNLATGGHNCHGRYEYVVAEDMDIMVSVLLEIVALYV